jgi:hypothetical protein
VKASTMMLAAFALAALGHWSRNKPVATGKQVVQAVFALLVIAALDQGRTADIAKGFAGLFLAAVLLGPNSPLTAIAKAGGTTSNPPPVQTFGPKGT